MKAQPAGFLLLYVATSVVAIAVVVASCTLKSFGSTTVGVVQLSGSLDEWGAKLSASHKAKCNYKYSICNIATNFVAHGWKSCSSCCMWQFVWFAHGQFNRQRNDFLFSIQSAKLSWATTENGNPVNLLVNLNLFNIFGDRRMNLGEIYTHVIPCNFTNFKKSELFIFGIWQIWGHNKLTVYI